MNRETKTLTADEVKPNQEFLCYRIKNLCSMPCVNYIKEVKEDGVIIYDKQRPHLGDEKISRDAVFEVYLTDKEFDNKYRNAAKEIYDILSGSEYVGDPGRHEMYNGWLGRTCQELYRNLNKENWKLIGWFYLQAIKHGWFVDSDIGIIVEDETGERFWCHYSKESIDRMCVVYKEVNE